MIRRHHIERYRSLIPLLTLIVLILIVGCNSPRFLDVGSLITLATDTATLFVLAAGITFVVILGGIDLSGQSVASLASIVLASTAISWGPFSVPLAILVGAGFGVFNGIVYIYLRLPSFIATLAVGSIAASVALISSGMERVPFPPELRGTAFGWIAGSSGIVPHQIFVGLFVLAFSIVVERYTLFGRWSRAIGSGEPAARVAGVPINRVKITAMAISGGMAGIAGVLLATRFAAGSPTIADEFLLPAIAAIVVGGTAITGGNGSVIYTLIGSLIISVVRMGMTFMNIDIFAQQIVFGFLIIAASAATIDRAKLPIVK